MRIQMERWLLEFPATMRKAALAGDRAGAGASMQALDRHYRGKTPDERQAIFLSLARTILEDLDKDSHRKVETFLIAVGLLQKQRV